MFIHTDHSAIKYLMNKPITNGRITRWLLLIQGFIIIVLDRLGRENRVADFLSWLHTSGEIIPISNSFPDEHLFLISVITPWYVDIDNYLPTWKLPPHFISREKRKVIRESTRYTWLNGYLFYTSSDPIIRRCVRQYEIIDILKSCHDEPCGGHFADKRKKRKILPSSIGHPYLKTPRNMSEVVTTAK